MSASKDKEKRKKQIAEGTDKRSAAKAAEKAHHRKSAITYTIVAVCLVVFFSFIFIYNSTLPSRHMTAVTVNGQDYTVAQANFYYSSAYMNFYNTYSNYVSMFFDPNESLADQEYSEGTSWRSYFQDTAAQDLAQIQMLCDEAEAAGFTLSEEQQSDYDEEIENISNNWSELGYSSLQQFINLNYGKGVTLDMVKDELYRSFLASAYSQSVLDSYEYSVEELDSHYAEEANDYDIIEYSYYTISAPAEGTEDETAGSEEDTESAEETEATEETAEAESTEAAEETAEAESTEAAEETAEAESTEAAEETEEAEPTEAAEGAESDEGAEETGSSEESSDEAAPEEEPPAIQESDDPDVLAVIDEVDGTDEETFTSVIGEHYDGAEPTTTSATGSNLSDVYASFLLDSSRQPGDAISSVTEDGTTYLVMFLSRNENDYKMPGFRHILIQAEDTDGDGTISDEELQAADDEAQSIYEEWQDGDATEDSFAELANERSEDTGSNTNGGLYEDVAMNQMVEPINDWLFEEGREVGDTTVVQYDGREDGSYSGTHVLYFTGYSDLTYAEAIVDNELRTDAFNTWMEEHMTDYEPAVSKMGMSMVGKNH